MSIEGSVSTPRLWLMVFGLYNLVFGTSLFLMSYAAISGFSNALGGEGSDAVLMRLASDIHEIVGVLMASIGLIALGTAIGNKGADAKRPAIMFGSIGVLFQVHHIEQILSGALPGVSLYGSPLIGVILIALLLVTGVTYKGNRKSLSNKAPQSSSLR